MNRKNDLELKKFPIVELVDLEKQFEDKKVLNKLNIKIQEGEFITILGESGSGKTTALRLIGGFESPTRGEIKINGVDVKDLPAHKRPTKTIFQDYALFPHLSVKGNIMYGLKLIRVPKENLDPKVKISLEKNIEKWKEIARNKMSKLDKEQSNYEKILNKNNIKSSKYKKARKWLDSSDFHYSHWENFVQLKKNIFEKKFTTRKLTKEETEKEVKEVINLIGLEGNEEKSIDEISGGMKQRVALARAIITKPKILLLDEPLSALDLKVRQKMQRELKAIQKNLGLTFIFVTHDQEEAMSISDKIAVMRAGKIEQFDEPKKIYESPINTWVANFIGVSNIFDANVASKNIIECFNQKLPGDTHEFSKDKKVKVMIRPEDVKISEKNPGFLSGNIETKLYQGTFWEYSVNVSSNLWRVRTTKEYEVGKKVNINWTAYDVHLMEN